VLAQVKFRQEKFDDALDALSQAAKLEPQNAQVQNLLGLTLSQKGMRGPAETALRKAIQIEPGYGDAHNNLAVVYVTQQPPLLELAKWHYQKALAAGNPHNTFLEKAFTTKVLGDSSK
jgi:cytochrome c-type biogenesis protein CcmH/NrfG